MLSEKLVSEHTAETGDAGAAAVDVIGEEDKDVGGGEGA
jgi:hypothetical protein